MFPLTSVKADLQYDISSALRLTERFTRIVNCCRMPQRTRRNATLQLSQVQLQRQIRNVQPIRFNQARGIN